MTFHLASPPIVATGLLVHHSVFGCCKIIGIDGARVEVAFCDTDGRKLFSRSAIMGGDFQRATLHAGSLAIGPHGQCVIIGQDDRDRQEARQYRIEYSEDGLGATVSEVELTPLPSSLTDSLHVRLLNGRADLYAQFSARHRLLNALARSNRQVGGLRALLAARIDLHPHQAFVAGTVILDPVRRYVLADEVGLGKTIEAGIILHDLLSRRPDARILVLTPGPLTRQWLCEMHSSFGGQGFKLADLYSIDDVDLERWTKVICSTNFALDGLDNDLVRTPWDLVIVDEVHHLLNAPHLYDLVLRLSRRSRDLILLSAVPVRRREAELYRLLVLLDPRTYGEDAASEEKFLAIYAAQETLGRRLNLLQRDLADLQSGDADAEDVIAGLDRLASLPILAADVQLQTLVLSAHAAPDRSDEIAREIHAMVTDRYRVNRRILRNRRERLISQEHLTAITRISAPLQYEPDQVEVEAIASVEACLSALAAREDLPRSLLRPFSHMLLQALVDPVSTTEVLTGVRNARGATVNSYGLEMLNAVVGMGGERWRVQLHTACEGIKPFIDQTLLETALRRVSTWAGSTSSSARWESLATLLRKEIEAGRKTLVFAGFPGVAKRLADRLSATFGEKAVTEFRSDLDDMVKEENVRRFRVDANVAIMVSDESGGEGRNFQFAHSLVHADIPWQPAVIEQRVGRLDRLGREAISTEVISHICVSAIGWEEGLFACYHQGLDLFGTSISGLEFALRGLQDDIVDAALRGGQDQLHDLVPQLRTLAADERVRDDSEALLDEASYSAARADRFVKAPIEGNESDLENAFLDYFRALTAGKGVWSHKLPDGTPGVWGLRPSDAPHGELEIVDRDAAGELGKRIGTFQRAVAQRHREVEFFTYGNPLFDAVAGSLNARLTARTYAVACRAPGTSSFVGLEVIVAARPQLNPRLLSPSLLNLAEAMFGMRRLSLFIPLLEGQSADRSQLEKLRASLSTRPGGPTWKDLSGEQVQHLVRAADGDLAACWERVTATQIPMARRAFEGQLAAPLSAERERLELHRRRLIEAGDAASIAEAEILDRYSALIESWDIVIDGVGFLAVNPRS